MFEGDRFFRAGSFPIKAREKNFADACLAGELQNQNALGLRALDARDARVRGTWTLAVPRLDVEQAMLVPLDGAIVAAATSGRRVHLLRLEES
jgi:hypothetical protein